VVPVREEDVTVEKQPVVSEEVEIGKRAAQEMEQVEGTIRRQETRVEHSGQVPVSGEHQHHFVEDRCVECGARRN
jgi:stress response protein YsnF